MSKKVVFENFRLHPHRPRHHELHGHVNENPQPDGWGFLVFLDLDYCPTIFVLGCSLLRRLTTVTTAWARLMKARPVAESLLRAAGVPWSPLSQML